MNGVSRGGSFLSASYEGHRSAKRVSSDKARGYGNVGFRAEWCAERWVL